MENKEMNPLDALFKNIMEGRESTPLSASWAQMESLLDAQNHRQKKKKIGFWYWAAASTLPFLMFSVWFFGFYGRKAQMAQTNADRANRIHDPAIVQTRKSPNSIVDKLVLGKYKAKENKVESIAKNGSNHNDFKHPENRNKIENQHTNSPKEDFFVTKTEVVLDLEMPKETQPLLPIDQISKIKNSKDADYEFATIEFKPGKTFSKNGEDQLATVEWKPEPKTSLSEKITNIKTGQFKNIPTMVEAKESLFALLSPKR